MADSLQPAVRDVLIQVRDKVFPPGTSLVTDAKVLWHLSAAQKFWVIPGSSGAPRWIIPHQPWVGLPVLANWCPYDPVSLFKWHVLLLAYRFGALGLLPGVLQVGFTPVTSFDSVVSAAPSADDCADWSHLGWSDSFAPPVPLIYVGTPSTIAKLVVTLCQGQKPRQVCKIPVGALAGANILHEASILRQIERHQIEAKPADAKFAPQIEWLDEPGQICTQNYLDAPAAGAAFGAPHVDWLLSLHREGQQVTLAEKTRALADRLARFPDTLPQVRTRLDALMDATPLPACCMHGDFVCWNVKQWPDGSLALVDWEEADWHGLPFVDICHYFFMAPDLPAGIDVFARMMENAHVQQYLKALALSEVQARKLFLYYQLNFLCRKLEQGNPVDLLLPRIQQAIAA